jgi:acetolactate synthase small subunit
MMTQQRTFTCLLQAKHGALDRVLGMLTHRGFIPNHFSATLIEPQQGSIGACQQVSVTLVCDDDWVYDKLLKSISKQIHVLSVESQQAMVSAG